MIPDDRAEAVERALRAAFGVTTIDHIELLTRGNPFNRVFHIVVAGSPYLLKIILHAGNAGQQYACMTAAAGAGIAPPVRYASVEDRLSITDFVQTAPLTAADAFLRMPAVLRTLHALPPFHGVPEHLNTTCTFLMNQGPATESFLQKIRAGALLPEPEASEFLDLHAQLSVAYPRHAPDLVSSHNDLFKPDNVLSDGQRLWLVDWEAAFLNDRYADLAVFTLLVASNEAERTAFLHAYLGEPPTACQLARLYLMQQLAHLFYTMGFLFAGSGGKPVGRPDTPPELVIQQERMWAGDLPLKDNESRIAYAWAHWYRLQENVRTERFRDALRVLAAC
jgi:thiamine kinase-like enzyme